jgi:quercetin dioxygenase-like cupin family protein
MWRLKGLPALMSDDDGLGVGVVTLPSAGGLVYRIVTVPPDSDWDKTVGYQDSSGTTAGLVPIEESGGIPGLHVTDTLDIVTVISGELHAVLETGDTLLTPGDTLVQRGTKHAWSNRSDKPATIVALMVDAQR